MISMGVVDAASAYTRSVYGHLCMSFLHMLLYKYAWPCVCALEAKSGESNKLTQVSFYLTRILALRQRLFA